MHVKEKVKSVNTLPVVADSVNVECESSARGVCKAIIRTEQETKNTPTVVEKTRALEGMLPAVADSSNAECEPSAPDVCKALIRTERGIKKAPTVVGAFFMARPGGFEPSTYRFVAGHSIH